MRESYSTLPPTVCAGIEVTGSGAPSLIWSYYGLAVEVTLGSNRERSCPPRQ